MSEKIIGVCKISNIVNKKYYIGYSGDIDRRFKEHKRRFKTNKHNNSYFQRAYNKYGEENFTYEIIHTCETIDKAKDIETTYLDDKSIRGDIYNLNFNNSMDGHFANNPNKEEIRKKISESAKEKFRKMIQEERSTIYGRFGKKHTEKTKQKLRNIFKGRIVSEETREKLRIASTGHKLSEESIEKIRQKNKGKIPPTAIKIKINNIIYNTITEAGRKLGICRNTMMNRLNSKSPKFKHYELIQSNKKKNINKELKLSENKTIEVTGNASNKENIQDIKIKEIKSNNNTEKNINNIKSITEKFKKDNKTKKDTNKQLQLNNKKLKENISDVNKNINKLENMTENLKNNKIKRDINNNEIKENEKEKDNTKIFISERKNDKKISSTYTGKTSPSAVKVLINDVLYNSMSEAGYKLNLSNKTISKRIKPDDPKYNNYKFAGNDTEKIKESLEIISNKMKGNKNPFFGKTHSERNS